MSEMDNLKQKQEKNDSILWQREIGKENILTHRLHRRGSESEKNPKQVTERNSKTEVSDTPVEKPAKKKTD